MTARDLAVMVRRVSQACVQAANDRTQANHDAAKRAWSDLAEAAERVLAPSLFPGHNQAGESGPYRDRR